MVWRERLRLAALMVLLVALGLGSRLAPLGFLVWDKYLGDALYAALFYLGFSFLWPASGRRRRALLTAAVVGAVECFQLTPIPASLNQSTNGLVRTFAYLVLGSTFSGWDLLAYGCGILLARPLAAWASQDGAKR